MDRRHLLQYTAALGVAAAFPGLALAQQQRAICYNCPPEWADWGGMLKLISQKINIAVRTDNKNSGQSLAALIAEKANPVADVVYLGGQVGPQAREAGVLAPYKPERWNDIPATLKAGLEPDGCYDRATEAALNDLYERIAGAPLNAPQPVPSGYHHLEVVDRVRRWVGRPLSEGRYVLGAGAKHTAASPFAPIPDWLAAQRGLSPGVLGCDCSGMVAWGCGYVRGDWNTDAMARDAWRVEYGRITDRPGPRKLWLPVADHDLRPGDVLVYPGPDKDKDGRRDSPGHTGIVSSVEAGTVFGDQDSEWWERVKMVHCSSRDQAKVGAIRETTARLWWDPGRSVAIRCRLVRYA